MTVEDYTALVAELRQRARLRSSERFPPSTFVEGRAADAIASLESRLAKVRGERDELTASRDRHVRYRRQTEAERDRLAAMCGELERALRDIAESDDIDNALDPARNKRVARAVLQEPQTSTATPDNSTQGD